MSHDEAEIAYPPAPWRLGGSLFISLWLVRPPDLPTDLFIDPQHFFGRCILATAFAVYEPGGVLSYNELLLAIRVRALGRGMVSIPRIWVDNAASVAGARALWAVPKEFAEFTVATHETQVHAAGDPARAEPRFEARSEEGVLARMRFRQRAALPGCWRIWTSIAQPDDGELKIARTEALAKIAIGSARWDFPPESPLGFLHGRPPLVSLRLHRMTMLFGI
jgi:hypothetical protein